MKKKITNICISRNVSLNNTVPNVGMIFSSHMSFPDLHNSLIIFIAVSDLESGYIRPLWNKSCISTNANNMLAITTMKRSLDGKH